MESMREAKEYLPLMLCWANCFSLSTFLLHLSPWRSSANLWVTRNLSLPYRELGMWQGGEHPPIYCCQRDKGEKEGFRARWEMAGESSFLLLLPRASRSGGHGGACSLPGSAACQPPAYPVGNRVTAVWPLLATASLLGAEGRVHNKYPHPFFFIFIFLSLFLFIFIIVIFIFSTLPPNRCALWKCLWWLFFPPFLLI